ncbi:MAG: biosynthetic arginine decarboxylase [Fibromonadaceae bacterium]|jgi:arginine decarboxylase|nr:biosynthetic arginine decarboxylase [Fibromonadaceae bacterium]
MRKWTIDDSRELYNIKGWGISYFDINDEGHATVCPLKGNGPVIDLAEVMRELSRKDIATPVLLRFPDILDSRIEKINSCFEKSIGEYKFGGKFYNVFPIKVNQQRAVLEEVLEHGKKFNIGLEAGSKSELHAVLANVDNPESLIICNGYKDEDFIELALLAQKMGKKIFLVVEKVNELSLIIKLSKKLKVKPNIGIRIKLASSGSGHWEESGGYQSKFGLNSSELIDALQKIKKSGFADCVKLIHFHLGSQITNIRRIKSGLREIAQFYSEMNALGFGIEFVDVGGGLGVDYDGTNSTRSSSVNYSVQEYANDVVYAIAETCSKLELPHPNIIAETGRALTAHHSLLVFDILEKTAPAYFEDVAREIKSDDPDLLRDLHSIYKGLVQKNLTESWHDAVQIHDDVLNNFRMGTLNLENRAIAERLFWSIARKVNRIVKDMRHPPYELDELPRLLAEKYFGNFSLFQSLPDAWAIDQIFPVMPIQRLNEEPTVDVTIQDITCDSDGKIDLFVSRGEIGRTLPLHPLKDGKPYYLGVYLIGAYQEILGDLHNLFGDTNVVHISCKGDSYEIEKIIAGESVSDVLEYVNFSDKALVRTMENWVKDAIQEGKISKQEGREFLSIYRSGLYGYTYLE